nr:hypothetical protein [Haliscomenobacter sp.]
MLLIAPTKISPALQVLGRKESIFSLQEKVLVCMPEAADPVEALATGSSFAAPTVAGVAAALLTHMSSGNWAALKCAIFDGGTVRRALDCKCFIEKAIHAPGALEKLASCGAVVLPPVVSVREIMVDIQIGADPLLGTADMVKLVVLFSGGRTLEFDKHQL